MNAPVIEGLSEEFIRKNEKYLKATPHKCRNPHYTTGSE